MILAFPIFCKKACNSRRQIRAVPAKGMQTGTCSLPKIMKGYYINPLNTSFLPEAEGYMLVLWNAPQQQQPLTMQTCIGVNTAVIKCLNRDRESTLQVSKKKSLCLHLSERALTSGGIIQPYCMFKNYHNRTWRDYFLQYGIPYIFILVQPPLPLSILFINAFCRYEPKNLYQLICWAGFVLRSNSAELQYNKHCSIIHSCLGFSQLARMNRQKHQLCDHTQESSLTVLFQITMISFSELFH